MFPLIERYIKKLSIDDIYLFALKNNINLNESEVNFIYMFVKKNYKEILSNSNNFNIDKYKNHFSDENFAKIKVKYFEYLSRYQMYLK